MPESTIARNYKDSLFRAIFSKEENLLELYEALTGKSQANARIELSTIREAIYATRKNDVAFTVDDKVVILIEHMSSPVNINMPLRMLHYVATIYERMTKPHDIYCRPGLKMPNPVFFVFCNDVNFHSLRETLRLSDSYQSPEDEPQLELRVEVINVNYEAGAELLRKCTALHTYSWAVSRMRELTEKDLSAIQIMAQLKKEFEKDEAGRKFFAEYGTEGMQMLYEELTEEEYQEIIRENSRKEGLEEGLEEGLKEGLEEGLKVVAANLKKEGIPMETIITTTGLSQTEIESL